MDIKDKELLL